jgi:hypothetical protein
LRHLAWAREELNLRPHAYQPGNGDSEVRHLHRKNIDGQRDLPGSTLDFVVSCRDQWTTQRTTRPRLRRTCRQGCSSLVATVRALAHPSPCTTAAIRTATCPYGRSKRWIRSDRRATYFRADGASAPGTESNPTRRTSASHRALPRIGLNLMGRELSASRAPIIDHNVGM